MSSVRFDAPALCLALLTSAPAAFAADTPLRYFVGKEVVVVQASKTTKTTRAIETLKGNDRMRCVTAHSGAPAQELCVTERAFVSREGTITTRLVPDPTLAADVTLAGKTLTDDSMTIELRDGMLLRSVNAQSTGRAGDFVVSLAKFAGFLAIVPSLAATTGQPSKAPTRDVGSCNPFERPLTDQPDVLRLWLWENEEQCERWRDIRKRQNARDALLDDRLALERAIKGAAPGPALQTVFEKLEKVESAIKKEDSELKARQEAFNTQLEAFAASLRLGTTGRSETYDQVLDLSDLPTLQGLSAGMTEAAASQVTAAWTGKTAALDLWNGARLIVTFEPAVPVTCSPAPVVPATSAADKKNVRIHFRQGLPGRMRAFIADQPPDGVTPSTLRVIADRVDNYVHNCVPVSTMTFSRSAWADRELSLTFDDRGRPVKLVRTSKSDAAAMAAALSSAATSFRDEMAATVAKAADMQANRRKIELDDLTSRIEKAKAEKELLDAQLALGGASANYDVALKQKQAAANLDLLKADLALATAQSTAEQAQQIEALKAAINLVNQQLDLLRAQQALDKAKQQ